MVFFLVYYSAIKMKECFSSEISVEFQRTIGRYGRPEWSRSLRHELSSPARGLGSWVRIPLGAWMCSCGSLCRYRHCKGTDPPLKESSRLCKDQETEKAAKVHKGCRAVDGHGIMSQETTHQNQIRTMRL
jgi:hypothetical protein